MNDINQWLLEDDKRARRVCDSIAHSLGFKCIAIEYDFSMGHLRHEPMFTIKFYDDAKIKYDIYAFSCGPDSRYSLGYPVIIVCKDLKHFWASVLLENFFKNVDGSIVADCNYAISTNGRWKYFIHKGQTIEELLINLELGNFK